MGLSILFFFLFSFPADAQMILKTRNERSARKSIIVKQGVNSIKSSVLKKEESNVDEAFKLSRKEAEIDKLLSQAEKRPNIKDFSVSFNINTGTVIKGRLLNSILSTNLLSPVIVEVLSDETLPVGSRLICKGSTKYKRVHTFCSTLVMPEDGGEEYEVNVSLLNMDGSAGLKADEVYTNDAKFVVGQVAIEALKAAAIWDQTISTTAIGDRPVANDKNRLIGGLNGGLDAVGDIAEKELRSEEPKVLVFSGKEVLIYFEKRFKK